MPAEPSSTTPGNPPDFTGVSAAVTDMSIDSSGPEDSDSDTDSIPDLVSATAHDGDNTASNTSTTMHHPLAVVHMDSRAVNGIVNPGQSLMINPHAHRGASAFGQPNGGVYQRAGPTYRTHVGGQTMGPSSNTNWRAPAHVARRAVRDVLIDRANHPGYIQGHPIGQQHRPGRYPAPGGRPLNPDMIYETIGRLQRLEHALHGLMYPASPQWFHGHL
ncbi:hypothetical protein B0H16DRAFT_1738933 [Mycena metata]|uniref:Uncharacterized protein n=1 Tax=Mycena metata TaxID=1033252 RepID=A0AAD7MJJ1_9AGAR|nr:hypothetical protein B0H16DRAFT_1738933 [Mycena metata]